ncbi:hypothetical protein Dda_2401 [Drechslerella dactyloides]|uniref:Uncharacterized protein n=1 Tax=Drechslerella dactyloides TaxID=74499 RepID=A0AAD6NMB3_DREDA|nr:hypothetical protein Dda_2401 [Drechslerella dactyloides]
MALLRRDSKLSRRFGPGFDLNTDFVYVNPRAIAWELMDANSTLPPGHPNRPSNPWLVSDGDPRAGDPLYKEEYMLVDRASLAKIKHLQLPIVPDEIALPAIEHRRRVDDDEYYEEMNLWFANEKRKEARRLLRASGLNVDEPLMIKGPDDDSDDDGEEDSFQYEDSMSNVDQPMNDLTIDMDRVMTPIAEFDETDDDDTDAYDDDEVHDPQTLRKERLPPAPAFEYQLPQVENARFFDDSYTLMSKAVRRQLELARALRLDEESFGADAPRFQYEIANFHKERLHIMESRKLSSRSTPQSLAISDNVEHILFDSTSSNLFVPITNRNPTVRAYLQKGQAEVLLLLDLMRTQWNRLEYLDHYFNPEYRALFHEHGHDISNDRIAGIIERKTARNFSNLTHHQLNVLELAVELLCEDLAGQLEEDLGDLLQFAVFKYINATPDQDLEMRQALLIIWEIKIVGTDLRKVQPKQSENCSCWARQYLQKTMTKYRVSKSYFGFFSKHCIKDHCILASLIDEDYTTDIPHPSEDIELESVKYPDRTGLIPSWMAKKHKLIPDLCREARHCLLRNSRCHASSRDHSDLIMALVWGRSHFLCDGLHHEAFRGFRTEIRAFINERDETTLKARDETLGKLMLDYDERLMQERRSHRMRETDDGGGKETDIATQYDAAARRASYIFRLASRMLGVSPADQTICKENICTQMLKKGWRLRELGSADKDHGTKIQGNQQLKVRNPNKVKRQAVERTATRSPRDVKKELKQRSAEQKKIRDRRMQEDRKAELAKYAPGPATKAILRLFGVDKAIARGQMWKGED